MPLRFEPPADPLTASDTAISYVIESDALQRLTKEIERYGHRELAGRSVLIAGHRGVGKSTLVRKAIENARGPSSLYQGRPLFVDLHGPDLLAPPDKEAAPKPRIDAPGNGNAETAGGKKGGQANSSTGGAGAGNLAATPESPGEGGTLSAKDPTAKSPSGTDLQSFVERLTFSLYRAAAKEFVDSFRALRGVRGQVDDSMYYQFSELAEQFALELDGSTDLGRIRLLYERVNAFDEGVLRTSTSVTGSQELALLAASSQAYRIISGKLDEDQKRATSGKNTVSWSITADNLLSPAAGLLTGSLVWTALPDAFGSFTKLFTSFTAGLASAIAVKFTRTIQRESTQSTQVSFVPERDRLALRRLLPVLVDRFRDIGLPPIFVVDELDKVEDISERMESLMGFLKQFVTERAFFCFLVDRDYYERLEATVSTHAFPKEATLFGDRLFVQYSPQAAHAYLKNVTVFGPPAVGESQSDGDRDLEVLPYVLLRRSYMHPFDLRREISKCTNARDEFRFPPRALFNVQQYRNEVYYQVAVECVLAGEKMLDFAEDPNRAQVLYDALYFPIRTRKLPEEFDASRDSLKRHVAGRMGRDNAGLLSDEDLDILHGALLELIRFLCDPRALLDTMQGLATAKYLPEPKIFPQGVVGVIDAAAGPKPPAAGTPSPGAGPTPDPGAAPSPGSVAGGAASAPVVSAGALQLPAAPASSPPPPASAGKPAPLLSGSDPDKYRWQFDRYGYPSAQEAPADAKVVKPRESEGARIVVDSTLLGQFDEASTWLATKHGTAFDIELWERMRLIPTPPTWSYLDEAASALRNPASLPPTKADEYNKALMGYRSNLQSALDGIWSAVAVAVTMSVHAREFSSPDPEWKSLEMLAEVLRETSARDQMLEQLEQIARDARSGVPLLPGATLPSASYQTILEALEACAMDVRRRTPKAAAEVAQKSASFYEDWFKSFYLGRGPQINAIWPFLSCAMSSLPLGLRNINPLRMTIAEWDQANRADEANRGDEPNRQKTISLERLGFRSEAAKLAVRLAESQSDEVMGVMLQSIRKRGIEKASVILQPLPGSLTLTLPWLPSENIACRINMPNTVLPSDARYLLVEVSSPVTIDQIGPSVANVHPTARIALFGAAPSLPDPRLPYPYPYIGSPQSLDDLVERLDRRPAGDWDPKSPPQQRP